MNDAAYRAGIEDWRRARLARLTAPDGWLTLVGLPWLDVGDNTIGSAADNRIVVAGLPPHLGTVVLDAGGAARIALAVGVDARIDDGDARTALLVDDSHARPTLVHCGDIAFFLVRRGAQVGLRIRDAHAPTRVDFDGLEYFPVDAAWRIEAHWHPLTPGRTLAMSTVIGTIEEYPVPGVARFERDGRACELWPVVEAPGDTSFFLVFADATSGRETYGAARFLYAEPPRDGRIVLDFNRAYNPPCAFTAFAACPMAPPENRLAVPVRAGEKAWRGGPHAA